MSEMHTPEITWFIPRDQTPAEPADASRAISLYNVLMRHVAQFGFAPTYRDLMSMMGYTSTSVVCGQLKRLEQWGWIARTRGKRAITLTRPTEAGLTPDQLRELLK